MEMYLKDVRSHTGYIRRSLFSNKRKRIFEHIAEKYGQRALKLYLKLGICCFVLDSLERIATKPWPDEITRLCYDWFKRIIDDLSTCSDDCYNYRSRSFGHDILVCILASIPIGGAWTIDIDRVKLRPFVCNGFRQGWQYAVCLAAKSRGLAPFYIIHTSFRVLHMFNEREMNLAYLRIAEMMRQDRLIRGLYRRSWLLDPALDKISPDLAYLRKVPQENGATLFHAGSSRVDVQLATAMSVRRRSLYAKGRYVPTGYAYVWPRKCFLKWAGKLQDN